MAEYIERETLLEKISRMINYCEKDKSVNGLTALFQVGDAIIDCKAVDVAPVRHGRWDRVIPSKSAAKWSSKVSCSVCHNAGYNHFKYCPNCGAKMDGERKEGAT